VLPPYFITIEYIRSLPIAYLLFIKIQKRIFLLDTFSIMELYGNKSEFYPDENVRKAPPQNMIGSENG
jgi:hypothetical protein